MAEKAALRSTKSTAPHKYADSTSSSSSTSSAPIRFYGDTALLLVREVVRTKQTPGALPSYRDDIVRDVVLEVKHLSQQLARYQAAIAALAAETDAARAAAYDAASDPNALGLANVRSHRAAMAAAPLTTASAMHSLALKRNKRCILAYQRHRIDTIIGLLWSSSSSGGGASTASRLPPAIQQNMSMHESEFAAAYKALSSTFRGHVLDIDLGGAGGTGPGGGINSGNASGISGIVPPKDVFAEIRVLQDCGNIMTESGPLRLEPGSQHYLRRSDVEDLITSGHVMDLGVSRPNQ